MLNESCVASPASPGRAPSDGMRSHGGGHRCLRLFTGLLRHSCLLFRSRDDEVDPNQVFKHLGSGLCVHEDDVVQDVVW